MEDVIICSDGDPTAFSCSGATQAHFAKGEALPQKICGRASAFDGL
jgi:hypothetical protein